MPQQDMFSKLEELRRKYTADEDQAVISNIERELRRKVAESKIKEIEVVAGILKQAAKEVLEINRVLAYSKDLSDFERRVLFVKRDERIFWLSRFGAWDAEQVLTEMDKFMDEKIAAASEQK